MPILSADNFKHYFDAFNQTDLVEDVINDIPNARAFDWLAQNAPLFVCPDEQIQKIYYYRWWTYRKHIKATPIGRIITEFITPVRHGSVFNAISCAYCFHLAEGRWLRDTKLLDEYTLFWFRGQNGTPQLKFHNYSQWAQDALLDRAKVTGNFNLLAQLFDELVADYRKWEEEKLIPTGPFAGLFWQFDVRDGMEESITGSRKHKNARPTISSYMFANARAIAQLARRFDRPDLASEFDAKARQIQHDVQNKLWDAPAQFFKAQRDENGLSDAREAIDFVPWYFDLPDQGYEEAWAQLIDPQGFWAPHGITTAERRHPQFRSHGVGQCEWDGAVWPFATSQTLVALANVLRHYKQSFVNKAHYLAAMEIYAKSHQFNGQVYLGEYLCESTGAWLKGDNPRSRFYNHSTFNDLVINGLIGLIPREDDILEIHPLLPEESWEYFCIDRVPYHGREVSILWDRTGSHFKRDAGLSVYVNDRRIIHSPTLAPVKGSLV